MCTTAELSLQRHNNNNPKIVYRKCSSYNMFLPSSEWSKYPVPSSVIFIGVHASEPSLLCSRMIVVFCIY